MLYLDVSRDTARYSTRAPGRARLREPKKIVACLLAPWFACLCLFRFCRYCRSHCASFTHRRNDIFVAGLFRGESYDILADPCDSLSRPPKSVCIPASIPKSSNFHFQKSGFTAKKRTRGKPIKKAFQKSLPALPASIPGKTLSANPIHIVPCLFFPYSIAPKAL